MRTPTGSRWASNDYIIVWRSPASSSSCSWSQLGDKMPAWESAGRLMTCGTQRPTVWCERCAAMVRRTLGEYVTACPRLQLTSHTQTTLTLSQLFCDPFENKVGEVYFYKEVRSFVHWNRHYVWLCSAYIWICMWQYNTHTHTHTHIYIYIYIYVCVCVCVCVCARSIKSRDYIRCSSSFLVFNLWL